MLKKAQRITTTRELQRVYRLGKPAHTPALVIKFVRNRAVGSGVTSRTAFVVSKRVSKKAVDRNRIKRVLREALRLGLGDLPTGDYMVMVKPLALLKTNAELREDFRKALAKATTPSTPHTTHAKPR
jgi:ribonuclease P protein component